MKQLHQKRQIELRRIFPQPVVRVLLTISILILTCSNVSESLNPTYQIETAVYGGTGGERYYSAFDQGRINGISSWATLRYATGWTFLDKTMVINSWSADNQTVVKAFGDSGGSSSLLNCPSFSLQNDEYINGYYVESTHNVYNVYVYGIGFRTNRNNNYECGTAISGKSVQYNTGWIDMGACWLTGWRGACARIIDNIQFQFTCASVTPTAHPSETPTAHPSETPTAHPSKTPTSHPSATPTGFSMTTEQRFVDSRQFGGDGGSAFAFTKAENQPSESVTGWTIHYDPASNIIGLALRIGAVMTPYHGGTKTVEEATVKLNDAEWVVAVSVRNEQYMNQINFLTSLGRQFSYGSSSGESAVCSGARLVDFAGRSDSVLDAVTFRFATT